MKQENYLDISFYHIQLFVTLAEIRSFSEAANILFIAQPTLTRRINILEQTLGFMLFDRGKRPIELTPAGELLYQKWKPFSKQFIADIETAKQTNNYSKASLSVFITNATTRTKALEVTTKEFADSANITTKYTTIENWTSKLQDRKADLFITLPMQTDSLDESFDHEQVLTLPTLVCMLKSNPLHKKKRLSYADLKDQMFVINSPQVFPVYFKHIQKYCHQSGFEPKIARYVDDSASLVWSLKADNEVIICNSLLRDIDMDFIATVPLNEPKSGLIAVWKSSNKNPLIRKYIDRLKDNFDKYPIK